MKLNVAEFLQMQRRIVMFFPAARRNEDRNHEWFAAVLYVFMFQIDLDESKIPIHLCSFCQLDRHHRARR
jgi:hypothetical protein